MKPVETIHIKGYLFHDGDEVWIGSVPNSYFCGFALSETIATKITSILNDDQFQPSVVDADNDPYCVDISMNIPRVSFRVHYSDEKCTLEEALDKHILMSVGELDIYRQWYGYSEWTILGYDLINFKLVSEDGGEHDLKEIFKSNVGKYVHILIDILEDNETIFWMTKEE